MRITWVSVAAASSGVTAWPCLPGMAPLTSSCLSPPISSTWTCLPGWCDPKDPTAHGGRGREGGSSQQQAGHEADKGRNQCPLPLVSFWMDSCWAGGARQLSCTAAALQGRALSGVSQCSQPPCFACSCAGFSRRPLGREGGNTNLKVTYVHSSYTLMHFHIIYL